MFRAAGESATFVGTEIKGPETLDGVLFPRENEGRSGWAIAQTEAPFQRRGGLTEIVESSFEKSKPQIVLLHIGTNDIGSVVTLPMDYVPTMNERLEILVDRIEKAAPKALLVVAQILPMGGGPPFEDPTNKQIKIYNAGIRAMVERRRARGQWILTVDMWTAFATNKDYNKLAGDGIHPSDAGYDVMAKVWHDAIAPYLIRR